MTPGKFLQRILKVSPTGDMPKTMCRLLALLLTKYCHKLSLDGPAPFWRASSRNWLRTDSLSSSGNSAGTIPTKGASIWIVYDKCSVRQYGFWSKQTWGEHVVNEFQESFLCNMCISEKKHCLLIFNAKLQVQCFQVITEVRLIVPSAELYLKYL